MDTPEHSPLSDDAVNEAPTPPVPKNNGEGFRTPKITNRTIPQNSWLTDADAVKPQDRKLIMPAIAKRAARKSHPVRNGIVWIVILAVLGYASYRAYLMFGPEAKQHMQTSVGYGSRPVAADNSPTGTLPVTAQFGDSGQALGASTGTESSVLVNATSSPASTTAVTVATATSTSPAAIGAGSALSQGVSNPGSPAGNPTSTAGRPGSKSIKINDNSLGYLNVRSEPSSSGKVITQVHPGEQYAYGDAKYGWYEITLGAGKTGWVSGQYVTVIN